MKFSTLALLATTVFAAPTPLAAEKRLNILPTILFTPGAWHGTWAFDTVRASLEKLGYPTDAVALPTVGSTDPTVGVAEDAAALAAELEILTAAGKDVVMVCHSYGGVVASTAVEGYGSVDRAKAGKTGGVVMLVYMTAFAAPANTSLVDALGGVYLPWMIPDSTGDFVFPATPEEIFYADVENKTLVAEAVAALKNEPARIFSDDNLYEPWSNGVEVAWFFTEQDQAIPLATQQSMASQFPTGYVSYTMNSSHSPFLSMPDELTKNIVLTATEAMVRKPLNIAAAAVSTVVESVSGVVSGVVSARNVSSIVGNATAVAGEFVGEIVEEVAEETPKLVGGLTHAVSVSRRNVTTLVENLNVTSIVGALAGGVKTDAGKLVGGVTSGKVVEGVADVVSRRNLTSIVGNLTSTVGSVLEGASVEVGKVVEGVTDVVSRRTVVGELTKGLPLTELSATVGDVLEPVLEVVPL